jgi:hypothetical protein
MEKNVGKLDANVRYALAGASFVLALALGAGSPFFIGLLVFSVVMALTAYVGRCGIYKLIGVNTCPLEKK